MGTTIRRQPITNNIPASPDYKFLNITNFGGIEKSSNPFVVSSNTASDCLNVYVDEDNALTTRPRLEQKADLIQLVSDTYPALNIDGSFDVIAVYDLHDGYLLHGVKSYSYYMFKFTEEGALKKPIQITGDIPKKRCLLFEQDDKIFLMDGASYKNIINNEVKDVEYYIPTTTIGKNKTTVTILSDGSSDTIIDTIGVSYESFNALTYKYKETYFWDGLRDVEEFVSPNDTFENNYSSLSTHNIKDYNIYCKSNRNSDFEQHNYYGATRRGSYGVLKTDKNDNPLEFVPFEDDSLNPSAATYGFVCSGDGLLFILYAISGNADDKIHVFRRDDVDSPFVTHVVTTTPSDTYNSTDILDVKTNSDGSYILYRKDDGRLCSFAYNRLTKTYSAPSTWDYIVDSYDLTDAVEKTDEANKIGVQIVFSALSDWSVPEISDVQSVGVSVTMGEQGGISTSNTFYSIFDKVCKYDDPNYKCNSCSVMTTRDAKYQIYMPYFRTDNTTDKITQIKTSEDLGGSVETIRTLQNYPGDNIKFLYNDKSKIYFVPRSLAHANTNPKGGFIDLINKKVVYGLYLPSMGYTMNSYYENETLIGIDYIADDSIIYTTNFYFDSSEALLVVTKILKNNTQEYKDIENVRDVVINAQLKQRFHNNIWFASKNNTAHTEYNNPTYIPISSYNNLGESFDNITGLNVINDNVLAIYKRNRIYIITPVTVGDKLTYSYTETKNVIGNDAIGAPILTILTEMPTIVSYDGVYALNQLENVQSSDRITTLISEAINPLWLKENKEDIDNCKTLNRLYWTYYILPNKEKGISKIYLLDNRTQQWYYWELPIYVLDAYVKNNKTHLVTEDGLLYSLETSDLINEYNTDVTEYYDKINDKKHIIPWHWYSQILSLNTINYSKKLVDTTFILTDTDTQDEYALDYSFKAWRKSVSETNSTTINNNIHYVKSTTKRTMIPRFNFIQFRLNNTEDDLDNNKLRLVGLGLKYVLLEGLY